MELVAERNLHFNTVYFDKAWTLDKTSLYLCEVSIVEGSSFHTILQITMINVNQKDIVRTSWACNVDSPLAMRTATLRAKGRSPFADWKMKFRSISSAAVVLVLPPRYGSIRVAWITSYVPDDNDNKPQYTSDSIAFGTTIFLSL